MSWKSRIAPLRDVATRGDLDVVKLALQKEIEQARLSTTKGDRTGKALAPKRDQMGKEGDRERQGQHHKVGNRAFGVADKGDRLGYCPSSIKLSAPRFCRWALPVVPFGL